MRMVRLLFAHEKVTAVCTATTSGATGLAQMGQLLLARYYDHSGIPPFGVRIVLSK